MTIRPRLGDYPTEVGHPLQGLVGQAGLGTPRRVWWVRLSWARAPQLGSGGSGWVGLSHIAANTHLKSLYPSIVNSLYWCTARTISFDRQ